MAELLQKLKKQSSRVLDKMKGGAGNDTDGGDPEDSPTVELQSQKNSTTAAANNNDGGPGDDDSQQQLMDQNETSWAEELSQYCPKLTFQERLIGFATTFGLGYLIAFFSFRFFLKLMHGNPIPFAMNYTAGHVLQLLSSMFLCGPQRQFRLMFDKTRYMTSMVYLCCLGTTFVLIFIPIRPHLLKLFILLMLTMAQFCASGWYSLSYIPYGRRTALRLLYKTVGLTPPRNNNSNNNNNTSLSQIFQRSNSNTDTAAASSSSSTEQRQGSYRNLFSNGIFT